VRKHRTAKPLNQAATFVLFYAWGGCLSKRGTVFYLAALANQELTAMDEKVKDLSIKLGEPSIVNVNVQTAPAMNDYGFMSSAECRVSALRCHCVHCGLLADHIKDEYCYSNGRHEIKTSMIEILKGSGDNVEAALDSVLALVSTGGPIPHNTYCAE
jgi:hypothetical protein